jgi:hypothetical protein
MDRTRANSTIKSGLWLGALAIFVFGFAFYFAILYLG